MTTLDSAHYASQRRSTRVAQSVIFTVTGIDGNGDSFTEETGTLDVSYQGCRYFSRHAVRKDSWLILEIPNKRENSPALRPRARVVWVGKSKKLRGLFQVGVEFEVPGDVWDLAMAPEDWRPAGVPKEPDAPIFNQEGFEREMKKLLALAEAGTHYQLLRTTSESPLEQVRHSYYELARKFHPDLHADHAEWNQPLHRLMEAITLAYKTLTNETARAHYDDRLAASGTFTLGRQRSEVQKTAEECMEKARECLRAQNRGGAILWLRKTVELEPKSSKYQARLAHSLSAVVSFRREAADHFEKALEIDPWNTAARLELSELYEKMRLPWRARLHYQKVLEIDAGNSKAQEGLRLLDAEPGKNGMSKRSFLDRIFRHFPK